jgi:putative ABC transport system permease protein
VAALVAALIAGLLPALRAASADQFNALKGARTSAGRGERRLLSAIAAVQVVLTVALLAGAALLIRTANNLARVQPGYQTENILALTVTTVTPNTFREFHTQVLDRVAALPGVVRTAFAWGLPLTGNNWPGAMEIVGQSDPTRPASQINVPLRSVTADYFDLLGIRTVEGRTFQPGDTGDAARVAIVNEAFARKYLPGGSPIGRRLQFPGDAKRPLDIVGVVADTRTNALSAQAEPEVYLSFWQSGAFSKHLVVRTVADPASLTALVRREIRTVDPTAAVERATTMAQIRRQSLAPRTFAMQLLIGFAVVTTMLALVGIYGVLSLSVGARLKEIAVRKAVGAQRLDIVRMILAEGGRLVGAGIVVGAGVAVLLGRMLQGQLFEVRTMDPASFGAAALLFATVSLGACLVPALRAARTDVLSALHQE